MAAVKRSLYRPAQSLENAATKEYRSPLAQGRLVTKPIIPDTMTVYSSPATVEHLNPHSSMTSAGTTSITIPHSSFDNDGFRTPPRQSLANASRSSSVQRSPQGVLASSYSLEAQQVPRSPSKPRPTDLLDLSDGDDRHTKSADSVFEHIQHNSSSPVVMIDAGGRQIDPNASEVEIRTDLIKSPAKVICHAPAVVESDVRNTGYTQEATKVKVDSVPSVSLHDNLDVTSADQPPPKVDKRTKPVKVVKERQPSGSRVVASRYMQSTAASTRRKTTNVSSYSNTSKKSASQVSFNTTRKSSSQNETMRRPPSSVRPARKTIHRKTSKSSSRVATNPSVSDTPQMTGEKRRPKPSLSETVLDEGKEGPGGATSTPAGSVSQLPSRVGLDASAIQPIHGMSVLMSEDMSMMAQLSQSGERDSMDEGKGGPGGVMSTPAGSVSQLPSRVGLDASAIQPIHGMSVLMSEDMSMMAQLSQSGSLDSAYDTQHTTHHKKSMQEPEITQDYMDRVYAAYLQWVYMDSKLRKAFQEREKDAMGQLFSLWFENEKLRTHKTALELEKAKVKQENHVDEQLEIQRQGLGPITANSEIYKKQYSTMAHALDTTRHQLPLRGIHVPEDEDQYQDALIRALNESEELLGQINLTAGTTQGSKVNSFAKAIQTLERVVENEDKELKRCQELLAATSSLTSHACSLQIQKLEAQ